MSDFSAEEQQILRDYRRRLIYLGTLASGVDFVIFGLGIPLLGTSFGTSLIVDELVEGIVVSLIAKNKMRLKKRYRLIGLIPVPGVTALTVQCLVEYRKALRRPEAVLAHLSEA